MKFYYLKFLYKMSGKRMYKINKAQCLAEPDKYVWIVGKGCFLKSDSKKTPLKSDNKKSPLKSECEYNLNDHIKFYSGASEPYNKLSNFAHIKEGIKVDGLVFPSSEHAFQSFKYIESDRKRFSIDGDLGKLSGFELVYDKKEAEKKKEWWMKKGNIGIIAKMATNEKIGKKLGLKRIDNFKSTDELWMKILKEKYANSEFKSILLNTKNHYLLEFDRGAKRQTLQGTIPFWTGLIEDGILYGENKMGNYLMEVRSSI